MKAIHPLSLGVLLGAAALSAAGQSLPPLPSGFQADPNLAQVQAPMRAAGTGDGTSGKKSNDNMSPCFSDPKVSLGYGWMLNPAAKTMVEMLLKAPEDPAVRSPAGYLDEPDGKRDYQGGVLEWRKQTWPVISGHPCKDSQVVFYQAKWTGYAGNKMISIGIYNLYNSKGQGQTWIDGYIGKLTAALGSK